MNKGMPWPKTDTTHYDAQLEPSDKGRAVKGLVVWDGYNLEPFDQLTDVALGCY